VPHPVEEVRAAPVKPLSPLAAGDGAYDEEGFRTGGDGVGEKRVRRLVRKILRAREEAEEGAAFERDVIADSAAEHGIGGFERVEDGAERNGARDVEKDFASGMG